MKNALVALALVLVACTSSEAQQKDADRQKLTKLVELDQKVSKAMKEVDDHAIKGDTPGALERLEKGAKPAVEEADRTCESSEMSTPWGKTKRDEMRGVVKERKTEMPRYEEAVKSGDAEKLLKAMEAQAAIERRALVVVTALQQTTEGQR